MVQAVSYTLKTNLKRMMDWVVERMLVDFHDVTAGTYQEPAIYGKKWAWAVTPNPWQMNYCANVRNTHKMNQANCKNMNYDSFFAPFFSFFAFLLFFPLWIYFSSFVSSWLPVCVSHSSSVGLWLSVHTCAVVFPCLNMILSLLFVYLSVTVSFIIWIKIDFLFLV